MKNAMISYINEEVHFSAIQAQLQVLDLKQLEETTHLAKDLIAQCKVAAAQEEMTKWKSNPPKAWDPDKLKFAALGTAIGAITQVTQSSGQAPLLTVAIEGCKFGFGSFLFMSGVTYFQKRNWDQNLSNDPNVQKIRNDLNNKVQRFEAIVKFIDTLIKDKRSELAVASL